MSLPHVKTHFLKSTFLIIRPEARHACPVKISDADVPIYYTKHFAGSKKWKIWSNRDKVVTERHFSRLN